MLIANPLYDHAFKYLMSNDKLARKVLSVILEKEVLELELSQQEVVVEDEERRQKEKALEQVREGQIKLARVLLRTGMSAEEVALETGLTEDEVRKIEKNQNRPPK